MTIATLLPDFIVISSQIGIQFLRICLDIFLHANIGIMFLM